MSEPTTAAGRALLDMEAYNERSFALITPEAILAIEAEAIAAYRADLAARVRALPGDGRIVYPDFLDRAAVLAEIEEETR